MKPQKPESKNSKPTTFLSRASGLALLVISGTRLAYRSLQRCWLTIGEWISLEYRGRGTVALERFYSKHNIPLNFLGIYAFLYVAWLISFGIRRTPDLPLTFSMLTMGLVDLTIASSVYRQAQMRVRLVISKDANTGAQAESFPKLTKWLCVYIGIPYAILHLLVALLAAIATNMAG